MSRIERTALERRVSLRSAAVILDSFLNDDVLYPDEDVLSRSGVCKVLAEEYYPLVRLAQSLRGAIAVRLSPHGHPGPDASIYYWWRPPSTVQVTCSNENYDQALLREQLLAADAVVLSERRYRDKKTGAVVSEGRCLYVAESDITTRVDRIVAALSAKESKHHRGTDILIVQDAPARLTYLKNGLLHQRVRAEVRGLGPSKYRRIYVNYGDDVERVV